MVLNRTIYVTQPSLPSLNEFSKLLEQIWINKQLTNNGIFCQKLEEELCNYLNVKYISVVSNGTLALLVALKALEIEGEVITTPFSFVATTHVLHWNNITPVFCDIDENTFNIDPEEIEKVITTRTTALLPVHVYGNPCNVNKLAEIAKKHNLKLIFDAAHCFGVSIDNKSVLNFGDLSILSFHATKSYNTIEGGAIVCKTEEMKNKLDCLRDFGYDKNNNIILVGINAKMNEVQAAYGILLLRDIDKHIVKRKKVCELYRKNLINIDGITLLNIPKNVKYNYSYFPILIDKQKFGKSRNEVFQILKTQNIYTRPYFYPLISNMNMYKEYSSVRPSNLLNATRIAEQVLCLPVFADLEKNDQLEIINILINLSNNC